MEQLEDMYEELGQEVDLLKKSFYDAQGVADQIRVKLVDKLKEFGDYEGAEYFDRSYEELNDERIAWQFECDQSEFRVEYLEGELEKERERSKDLGNQLVEVDDELFRVRSAFGV